MAQRRGADRYEASRIRQHAKEAKQFHRTLETHHKELKRKKAFDKREAKKRTRELERLRRDMEKFLAQVEAGDYADKEAKTTVRALIKMTKAVNDWAKHPESGASVEAVAIAIALLVKLFADLVKKSVRESRAREREERSSG